MVYRAELQELDGILQRRRDAERATFIGGIEGKIQYCFVRRWLVLSSDHEICTSINGSVLYGI